MKVVFLDIDGVLATRQSYKFWRDVEGATYPSLSRKAVYLLNHLLERTKAKIVISSSWRNQYGFEQLKQILLEEGVIGEIVGKTPACMSSGRGDEILRFLSTTEDRVEKFVILDDDVFDITHHEALAPSVIHVLDGMKSGGLLRKHVEAAIAILGEETNESAS